MSRWLPLVIFIAACGGTATTGPSPTPTAVPAPVPAPVPAQPRFNYTGRVVSTQSGAPIPSATINLGANAPIQTDGAGTFSTDGASALLQATISAPGYLTRQTRLGADHPLTIDLIATAAPFSSIFYGQLVRNMLEATTPDVVRTLPAAPAFYLQTAGLSGGNVTRLIAAVRDVVPAMTGGRFTVTTFEMGPEARPERDGWIVIDIVSEPTSNKCGRANIGAIRGHIWLNTTASIRCDFAGDTISRQLIQHEVGHALGFFHIDVPNSLMNGSGWTAATIATDAERYHAALAYRRQTGNRDPDIDAATATPLSTRSSVIVVD